MKQLISLLLLLSVVACNESIDKNKAKDKTPVESTKDDTEAHVRSTTNPNTKVKTDVQYVDGVKQGISKQYYPSGKIWKESEYKKGALDGQAKIYHENGKLKRTVEYSDGKKNGKYTEYFKSGNVKAELSYEMDLPLPGIKEVDYRKKTIQQPEIKVRHEDLLFKGEYNLYFSLEPKAKNVSFYIMEEKEHWNSETNLIPSVLRETKKGDYIAPISIPEGYYFINELHVFATYTSKTGIAACTYKSVKLAIEND